MIAKLRGIVDSRGEDWAVLDVGGVGYLCSCSSRTLGRLPVPGDAVSLLVDTHVREDAIQLYGFFDVTERDWFRLLTTVQGVGGRVALALLSAFTPESLALAISAEDRAGLTRAAGVGPRLAARLITELKEKVGGLAMTGTRGAPASTTPAVVSERVDATREAAADAVSALVNLGYGRAEAFGAVSRAMSGAGGGDVQVLVRAALKEFARS
ncbi:MAG: Holliday junction branch migration protein RuvA [Alphaproteobacteria bacterium]|nr:Holliday junction branch migration protein RuvA [Alphaproteobacteria bacterium]